MNLKCLFGFHVWDAFSLPYFVKLDEFRLPELVKAAKCNRCGKKELRRYHGFHSGRPTTPEKIWDEIKKRDYTGD